MTKYTYTINSSTPTANSSTVLDRSQHNVAGTRIRHDHHHERFVTGRSRTNQFAINVSTPEPTPNEETPSQLFTKDDDPLHHTRNAITRRNEDPFSRVRERSNHYSNGLSDTTATINAARQYRHCDYITVAMSEYICGLWLITRVLGGLYSCPTEGSRAFGPTHEQMCYNLV